MAASEKVEEILKRETGSTCAFLIMDLDNFKGVNDSLGHLIGDKVLVDVATIIQHHVRSKDIVCRLGGDEFVVFLVDIPESMIEKNVTALLKKLNLTYGDGNKKEKYFRIGRNCDRTKRGRGFPDALRKSRSGAL